MSQTLPTFVSPSLLAFKPRQVLLSHHTKNQTNHLQTTMSAVEAPSLDPDHTTLLLHAVALFLQRNGFSKTLKKFRSEAHIQQDFSKDFLLSLEEMCYKHLKKCSQATPTQNKPDEEVVKEVDDDRVPEIQEEPSKKIKDKKKMKKNAVLETHIDTAVKEKSDSVNVESLKNSKLIESSEGITIHETAGKKSKDKKKKNKEKLESVATISGDATVSIDSQAVGSIELNGNGNGNVATLEEKVVKSKTKKKKDGRHLSEESKGTVNKNDDTNTVHVDEHDGISKKRKRLVSEDHDSHTVDAKETEDAKRRKLVETDVSRSTCNDLSQKTNEDIEKTAEKTSTKKALKKHSNGSAEPKTINAFQRVKVDAVTFADEKLADNSYWAKGGAEIGYGAKAQEVLGQVKGRDFRHEKTKKKRGSYRGGVIDLQSHSVKFNYSDDE